MVSVSSSLATDVARGEVGADHIIRVPRNALLFFGVVRAVVVALGADNLKIRPEFFPWGEASLKLFISAFKAHVKPG